MDIVVFSNEKVIHLTRGRIVNPPDMVISFLSLHLEERNEYLNTHV